LPDIEIEFGIIGSPFADTASFCHDLAMNVNADSCESTFDKAGLIEEFNFINFFLFCYCFATLVFPFFARVEFVYNVEIADLNNLKCSSIRA
jgi:hypothetical protein